LELVDQVLVFVEVILRDSKQVDVHHFVGWLFPSHESNSKSAFVFINKF
jgi:hypothetical protein